MKAQGGRKKASSAQFKAALRRELRRKEQEPEINFLNITAMLDIMTIILVFLLKSLGESAGAIPQSDDLRLPVSILQTEASQEGVVITLSKTQILVGDKQILKLPDRNAMVLVGAGAENKRNGADDLYITPLGNALSKARKVDKILRQKKGKDPSVSEAIIVADGTTPYRLLVEVMFTLGQNEFGKYHLMVMQGAGD